MKIAENDFYECCLTHPHHQHHTSFVTTTFHWCARIFEINKNFKNVVFWQKVHRERVLETWKHGLGKCVNMAS